MISRPERHEMSVIRRCRYAHGSRTPHVRVTELVGETLQLVALKVIVVPQHVVVRRSGCAL